MTFELQFLLVVLLCFGMCLYELSNNQSGIIAVSSLLVKVGLIQICMAKGVDTWLLMGVALMPLARLINYVTERLDNGHRKDH